MSTPLKFVKSLGTTDAMLVGTSVLEADHPVWSAATTYALGARVILTSTHRIYESLQASNLNHDPATEPLWWVEVSPTNRWKLFDLSSTTQTQIDASDYYEIDPGQAISAMALINISGVLSVRVRLTDPDFGVVYDQLTDLTPVISESSWYAWFYEPRTERTQFVVSNLPSYPNAILRVDLTSSGAAFVGGLVYGSQRTVGFAVQHGVRLGIQDYSRKERNDFGDVVLVQRAFAKRVSFTVLVRNTELDNTFGQLADARSTPCLWIGSGAYSSLSVFGFYNSFEIGIAYSEYSEISIDIEGLT